MLNKVLVANRGEIACRVIATARQLGMATVAIYSDSDVGSLHVLLADEAVAVGASEAAASYLDIDRVIAAAVSTGCDALHPGYGFLSENPDLADACDAAGIVFVGPTAAAMRAMALKDAAKERMQAAGVPVVPGYHGASQAPDVLSAEADKIGYPVLIKARAGGGGKGMRRVDDASDFIDALTAAQQEAARSFGDNHVLLEKWIVEPRHIEVQVFADTFGNVVHLFERDCSLQRRHQKVIEEAPAPGMSEAVRHAMTTAAIRCAEAIDYRGAGTVEFIVDGSDPLQVDGFWFMEMNTRLQVEHPVTEAVTGLDLVEWQFRVAAGESLPLNQDRIALQGHAVEARVYAENPASGFLPATGEVLDIVWPEDRLRVDTGIQMGDLITPFYDPMLAKLIAWGVTRDAAIGRLLNGLRGTTLVGVRSNIPFLQALLRDDDFANAELDTGLIERKLDSLVVPTPLQAEWLAVLAVAMASGVESDASVAKRLGAWLLWGQPQTTVRMVANGESADFRVTRLSTALWQVVPQAMKNTSSVSRQPDEPQEKRVAEPKTVILDDASALLGGASVSIDGHRRHLRLAIRGGDWFVSGEGVVARASLRTITQDDADLLASDVVRAPMPGNLLEINVAPGDEVSAGDAVATLEAMKMQHRLTAPRAGLVQFVRCQTGDQLALGDIVMELESDTGESAA